MMETFFVVMGMAFTGLLVIVALMMLMGEIHIKHED